MSGSEIALLLVAGAGVAVVALLAVALLAVTRTLRSLQVTVELLRQDAAARGWPTAASELAAAPGSEGTERRRRDAGSVLARVAVANPYLDVSDPVIKVLALASGTSRAASRLRRTRTGEQG